MPSRTDVLRETLDRLALDPNVREEREYLVSMLRRLGYTEAEIEEHLGPADAEPELPEPEPVLQAADDDRIVEVEYVPDQPSGLGQEFEPVVRMEREEQLVEFRQFVPQRTRMRLVRAEDRDAAESIARTHGLNVVRAFPVSVRRADAEQAYAAQAASAQEQADWEPVPTGAHAASPGQEPAWEPMPDAEWEPVPDGAAEAPPQPAQQYVYDPIPAAPAPAAPAAPASEPAAWPEEEQLDWEAPEEPVAAPAAAPVPMQDPAEEALPVEPSPAAAPVDAGDAFQHGDYTLYARDVELATGNRQRIYFFARGTPSAGQPSGLPDGYVVKENEKTGLPFLARDRGA